MNDLFEHIAPSIPKKRTEWHVGTVKTDRRVSERVTPIAENLQRGMVAIPGKENLS